MRLNYSESLIEVPASASVGSLVTDCTTQWILPSYHEVGGGVFIVGSCMYADGIESPLIDSGRMHIYLRPFAFDMQSSLLRLSDLPPKQANTSLSDLSWYFDAQKPSDAASSSSQEIISVLNGLSSQIAAENYRVLSLLLSGLKVDRLTSHMLVTFARATFPVRSKIDRWQKFISRVAIELNSRGKPADRLLKGLLTGNAHS